LSVVLPGLGLGRHRGAACGRAFQGARASPIGRARAFGRKYYTSEGSGPVSGAG